jgi:hypothetical protein
MIGTLAAACKQRLRPHRLRPASQCWPTLGRAVANDFPWTDSGAHLRNARVQKAPQRKCQTYRRRRVQAPIPNRGRRRSHDSPASLTVVAANAYRAHHRRTLWRRWTALLSLFASMTVQHDLAASRPTRHATGRTRPRPCVLHARQSVQPNLALCSASNEVRFVQCFSEHGERGSSVEKNFALLANLLIPETLSDADVLAFAAQHMSCTAYSQLIGLPPDLPHGSILPERASCSRRPLPCADTGSLLLLNF